MIYCEACEKATRGLLREAMKDNIPALPDLKAMRLAHCDLCLSETGPFFEEDTAVFVRVLANRVKYLNNRIEINKTRRDTALELLKRGQTGEARDVLTSMFRPKIAFG